MRQTFWNKCSVIVAQFVSTALHQTNCCSLDNCDRLIKIMSVAWERSAGEKPSMSAANPLRTEPACEQIQKESALRKLVNGLALIPDNCLWISIHRITRASIIYRKGSIDKLP